VDFGIAKNIAAADRTGAGEMLGTPRYMSPEQVLGRALDLRTDIYSAGVLLYRILTGKHMFYGQTVMEIARRHGAKVAAHVQYRQRSRFASSLDFTCGIPVKTTASFGWGSALRRFVENR
jgi:serine/threonine-protein kinase